MIGSSRGAEVGPGVRRRAVVNFSNDVDDDDDVFGLGTNLRRRKSEGGDRH
jgi:hypothetical protein